MELYVSGGGPTATAKRGGVLLLLVLLWLLLQLVSSSSLCRTRLSCHAASLSVLFHMAPVLLKA